MLIDLYVWKILIFIKSKGETMNKIWVVTQQGIPIMAYNQSGVTSLELWEKHLGCSVFDVEVQ